MTSSGKLGTIKNGKITFWKTAGKMSYDDKVWIRDLFSIPSALIESKELARVMDDASLTREQKRAYLAGIVSNATTVAGADVPQVVHGFKFDYRGREVSALEEGGWSQPTIHGLS
jgi:hypothetical protein